MSLYGALFSGVSGLKSQSTKLAVISDNVANVNTVGYKAGQALFQTLVTNSGGGTSYSPGGVLGGNRQLVDQQGLLQATNSPTDIAISGGGFFVVNQVDDGTGQVFYTRAGSFTQDSVGNFRNSAGFFLQAWPLDREGRLPGDPGNENTISSANLSSLRTVNVQNLTGVAAATTSISLSANLRASETVFPGSAAIVDMDSTDAINTSNAATDIIIPQATGTLDRLTRGDAMTINFSGGAVTSTFTYGGFTFGRVASSGAVGDGGTTVLGATADGESTIAIGSMTVPDSSNVVTINFPAAHGLSDDDVISVTGPTGGLGSLTAADVTGTFIVTVIDSDTVTIVAKSTNGAGGANPDPSTATAAVDIRPFSNSGEILDASSATQSFLGTTGLSVFATAALSFTITTVSTGTVTFTYKASAPNAQAGEFNNLTNLAEAIAAAEGLTARVSGGRIYISPINAEEAMTFANGQAEGTDGATPGTATYGIDWVRELDLADTTAVSGRFSTIEGLADLVNDTTGLSAAISSPLSDTELTINVDDPLDTITFSDASSGNTGSLVAALGLVAPLGGAAYTVQTTGALGPAYDPTDGTKNMASGSISPQFSRPIRVFDPLGQGHDLNIAFLKIGINTWATEFYALDPTEVTTSLPSGLLTYGTVTFNGDGSLQSLTSLLSTPLTISWQNGAEDNELTFNWGTAGTIGTGATDGLSQFDSAYKVNFANQNGAPVGELTGVSIDEDGFITASYSNGETQRLFKIPLADFASPNALQAQSGNVYSQTSASGEVNLAQAGSSGVGKFASSSLEASNVELADQLTDMIVAQRAYQANTKIISTASGLLDELNQTIR